MNFITVLLLCFLPVLCTTLSVSYCKRRIKAVEDMFISLTDPNNFTIDVHDDNHKHIYLSPSVCKAIEDARKSMKG